ncbi:acyltransferase [Chryseobacterium sp.]|uniref:acyltransferase family protein n=1 Tax=Chryseobacterium sp. TaxID=1871047 RepID=UPI0025BC29F0|nr:acyltransferase [Chryseobacterium sp.]MBV8324953.1 acyltransferase [Chryseobacterium sp.]
MLFNNVTRIIKQIFTIDIDENRVFGLDLLRFFAISFVFIGHGLHYLPFSDFLVRFMLDGVTLFFVLSGFLIGGILIKILNENKFDRRVLFNFWIRRWCRTLPAYFLVLSVLVILEVFFTNDSPKSDYAQYFLFIQSFASPHPGFFPEAWSLSVEEWFYLLMPIFLYGLIRVLKLKVKTSILSVIFFVILFVTLFRLYRYSTDIIPHDLRSWDINFRKQVITRLDSLMYGVLGAYIKYYYPRIWNKGKETMLVAGLILIIISHLSFIGIITEARSLYLSVFSFSLMSVGTLFLLPFLSSYTTSHLKIAKPVTYISLISYSMYLVNLSLIQPWIVDRIPGYFNFPIYIFLCLMIPFFIYKYFEIPTTKLRDRLIIRKAV